MEEESTWAEEKRREARGKDCVRHDLILPILREDTHFQCSPILARTHD